MFERPATPSDKIKRPYPNEAASRASNNGAYPPDLSLIIKARHDGANHLFSILTGYEDPPKGVEMMPGLHYNPYFEGGQIAMPAPLMPNMVTYSDGTPATVEQMARDVTIFLQWAAEPEMEHRKSMGLKVLIFLSIFTVVFFIAKKKMWKRVK
jgi:ubiquinol-cytochrome c reductase cytochrome c1 subunit